MDGIYIPAQAAALHVTPANTVSSVTFHEH